MGEGAHVARGTWRIFPTHTITDAQKFPWIRLTSGRMGWLYEASLDILFAANVLDMYVQLP